MGDVGCGGVDRTGDVAWLPFVRFNRDVRDSSTVSMLPELEKQSKYAQ